MNWVQALKEWNKGRDTYCIPKKGTNEYNQVKKLMGSGAPAEPTKWIQEATKKMKGGEKPCENNVAGGCGMCGGTLAARATPLAMAKKIKGVETMLEERIDKEEKVPKIRPTNRKEAKPLYGGKKVEMPKKAYMAEHKRLIELLGSVTKKLQEESTEQIMEALEVARK